MNGHLVTDFVSLVNALELIQNFYSNKRLEMTHTKDAGQNAEETSKVFL